MTRRILIVEDEDAIARGLQFNFEQEGYETVIAGDGATALREFEQAAEPFDLIVLDLMLPGMSGYETCRKVREIDRQVPILVLSARTLSEDRMQAFDDRSAGIMAATLLVVAVATLMVTTTLSLRVGPQRG